MFEEKKHLTPGDAAKRLNVSRSFLKGLIDKGIMPYKKLPNLAHYRILRTDFEQFKEEQKKKINTSLDCLIKESENMGLYTECD